MNITLDDVVKLARAVDLMYPHVFFRSTSDPPEVAPGVFVEIADEDAIVPYNFAPDMKETREIAKRVLAHHITSLPAEVTV